mmetsp:Transcript_28666/g.95143  ORF Transcript_28666/g.95143 Transcript_28666/m.95143 type:complete len:114 (-) Transcript_28666:1017-1358(-)
MQDLGKLKGDEVEGHPGLCGGKRRPSAQLAGSHCAIKTEEVREPVLARVRHQHHELTPRARCGVKWTSTRSASLPLLTAVAPIRSAKVSIEAVSVRPESTRTFLPSSSDLLAR